MAKQTIITPEEEIIEQPPFEAIAKGYRWRRITRRDGTVESIQVPLTGEDFLNPQEDDVMPVSTFHVRLVSEIWQMLLDYFDEDGAMTVFSELIFNWGIPGLKNPAPDIAVVPNVKDKTKDRSTFYVKQENTKPVLVIEVVSPHYRHEDLVDKVDIYEQGGVQEYLILERRKQGDQYAYLMTGYRLVKGHYRPIFLEDDGRMHLKTVGLFIRFENGSVYLDDVVTGEPLQTLKGMKAKNREVERRAQAAEAELAALKAELERLKQQKTSE